MAAETRPRRLLRLLALVLVVALPMMTATGCWDRKDLEDMGFILALGLDKGEKAPIRYTFQIAVPAALAPGRSAGGPGVVTETVEGDTLPEVINFLSTYRHKEVTLEQNKIVVIGRDLAAEGILESLGELVRNREFRRTNFLLISTSTAGEILSLLESEKNPAAAIEELVRLASRTGLAPVSTVQDWLTTYETVGAEPVAPIIGPPREFTVSGLDLGVEGGQGAGGEATAGGGGPATGLGPTAVAGGTQGTAAGGQVPPRVQVMGTAVFSGDRLVDFLSGQETQVYLMMAGKLYQTIVTFSMEDPPATVSATVKGESPRRKLTFEGTTPVIQERVVFEGDLTAFIHRGRYLTKSSDLDHVTQQMDSYVKKIADGLLQRMQSLGTDIFGFGFMARKTVMTFDEWINFDWPSYFRQAKISVEIRSFLRRTGTTLSPLEELPIYRRRDEGNGGGSSGGSGP